MHGFHLSSSALLLIASSAAADFSFSDPAFVTPGHQVAFAEVTDLDGDRDLDIVVARAGQGNGMVTLFRNLGDGTFAKPQTFPAVEGQRHLAVDDVNGDGFPDVILPASGAPPDGVASISIMLNKGDGTLSPPVAYATPLHVPLVPARVGLGDFDGDGDKDILSGDFLQDIKFVLLNDGAGAFDTVQMIPAAKLGKMGTSTIAVADLNGDGDLDAVFGGVVIFAGMAVSLNEGKAAFTAPAVITPEFTASVKAADLDNDGDVDLAAMHRVQGGSIVRIYRNAGAGTQFLTETVLLMPDAFGNDVAAADFDGDGDVDLVASQDSELDAATGDVDKSQTLLIMANRGDGTFEEAVGFPGGGRPWSMAIGDLDDNGRLDIVTANAMPIVAPLNVGVVRNLSTAIQSGDLNADGHVNGIDLAMLLAAWGGCPLPRGACAADLDGDGVVNGIDLATLLAHWG